MTLEETLQARSNSTCELCGTKESVAVYEVQPKREEIAEYFAYLCENCRNQIDGELEIDVNHWRCLNDSMWSQVPAVQVLAYRMLRRLSAEGWTLDLLDMLYLEEDVLKWAKAVLQEQSESDQRVMHKDSNGTILTAGDTVTIIKDLNVKGSSITAKRGTAVRNISLVHDNPEQIEGRVGGQQIVILTQFVKRSS
ncbi:MAG: PhnA domain-containing protein [Vicingaceae bacterium]